jgi:starch phosphorylase
MVREYAERAYLPAHRAAVALDAGGGAAARQLAGWRERLRASWPGVSVRSSVRAEGPVPVGSEVPVEAIVRLGGLSVDDVRVEVVAGEPDGEGGLSPRAVVPAEHRGAAGGEHRFVAEVPAAESGRLAVASRVVPVRPNGGGPDPSFLIAWEPD